MTRPAVRIRLTRFLAKHTGSKCLPYGSSISCLCNKDNQQLLQQIIALTHYLIFVVATKCYLIYIQTYLIVSWLLLTIEVRKYYVSDINFITYNFILHLPLDVVRSAVQIRLKGFVVKHTGSKQFPCHMVRSISGLLNKDDLYP